MTRNPVKLRAQVLTFVGIAYLAAGIAVGITDPLINRLSGPEAQVWGTAGRLMLFSAGTLLFSWGVATLRFRHRETLANLNLLAASLLIATPFFAEIGLRLGIAAGISKVQRPGLYADYLSDDDYFRLRAHWHPAEAGSVAGRFHPLLGWAPPRTKENPLGITTALPYVPGDESETLLFYGDSFVAGTTADMEMRIPQILNRLLPDTRVLNYGVGGFGLDQIYLRFKSSQGEFDHPQVIIGVLTTDLDRSVLTFRTGPKPYFTLQDGGLVLNGAPMVEGSPQWESRFTPDLHSYLLAYGLRSWHILAGGGDRLELQYRRQEKIVLNRLLITAIIEEASRHGLSIMFVTFASDINSSGEGWRESLLHAEITQHKVPYLDTRALFLAKAHQQGIDALDFMAQDGHPNARGNQIIAAALAKRLYPDLKP